MAVIILAVVFLVTLLIIFWSNKTIIKNLELSIECYDKLIELIEENNELYNSLEELNEDDEEYIKISKKISENNRLINGYENLIDDLTRF